MLDESFAHDSTCVVEMIAQALERVYKICMDRGQQMPSKLVICGDNTVRELKNQFCLSYAMNLLGRRKMRLISFLFLRKSHTHCRIDQLWGVVARRIANTDQLLNAQDNALKTFFTPTIINEQKPTIIIYLQVPADLS